jgi:hypothetical protein
MWCQLCNPNVTHHTKAGALRAALRAARDWLAYRGKSPNFCARVAAAAITCAVVAAAAPPRVHAQVTPADSAAVIVGVATRLEAEGRIDLARQMLQLVRDRYANTPAAAEAIRLLDQMQRMRKDESGRTELLVFGTTYGAALGIALPVAANSESAEAFGLGLLLGAPAGFLASRAYARSRSLSEGQASAIISGALWGAWQAFGWREVSGIGDGEECFQIDPSLPVECFPTDPDADVMAQTMIAGSVVGLGVGAMLSKKNISQGTAATVNFGALWGTWFGTALAILFSQDDSEHGVLTAALLGGNGGLLTGAINNRNWQLSESRARLISIAGVAGLLAGFGVLLIAQPSDLDNTAVILPLGGSIVGLALGATWTRNMPREAMLDSGASRLSFELPTVRPVILEKGRDRIPAIGINLIQARF